MGTLSLWRTGPRRTLSRRRWVVLAEITLTEDYLPDATKRANDQQQTGQRSLTAYDGWSRTPRPGRLKPKQASGL
jgi:hypothetical protein